ncbi:hypothetical protein [Aquimarina addita]|uniref:hypothetical protein n=1 Tax=Aquimarina addita TaxID=870485 RepID=UPI0031E6545E
MIEERKTFKVLDSKLITYIESSASNKNLFTITSIVDTTNKLTNKKLQFTFSRCDINPNQLIHTQSTNCVGYSHFYASICNFLIEKTEISNHWRAKVYVGELYFFGVNVHAYVDSSFFKNHDIVVLENRITGEKIHIDPTISDYFWIDRVTGLHN